MIFLFLWCHGAFGVISHGFLNFHLSHLSYPSPGIQPSDSPSQYISLHVHRRLTHGCASPTCYRVSYNPPDLPLYNLSHLRVSSLFCTMGAAVERDFDIFFGVVVDFAGASWFSAGDGAAGHSLISTLHGGHSSHGSPGTTRCLTSCPHFLHLCTMLLWLHCSSEIPQGSFGQPWQSQG